MLREFRRKIAGFLVVTMLVGQILQGQTLTSFAALADRATPSETPSETEYVDGKILLQIEEDDIGSAIRRGKNGADALKKDLIPFTGDAREGVYRTLREAMDGRVLVRQERLGGENSSCMYLISVDKSEDNAKLPERIDVIVVNADFDHDYEFLVQITGDEIDVVEANVSRYDVDYEIDETEEEETVTVPANGLVYDGASDDTEVIVPDVVVDTEPSDEVTEDAADTADTAADVTETPGGETSDAADTVTGESAAEEETGLEEESEDQISEDGAVSDEEVSEDIAADSETAAEEDTEIEDEEQSDPTGGITEEDSSQEETVTEDSEALQDEEEEEAEEVSCLCERHF